MLMTGFRPGLALTVFSALSLVILCGLGLWQLQRMAWKEGVIAEIDAHLNQPPIPLESYERGLPPDFSPVTVTGTWREGAEQYRASQLHQGEIGYRLLQPLDLDGGRVVIVDRGWVPRCWRYGDCLEQGLPGPIGEPPPGIVQVTGILRGNFEKGWFTPNNVPAERLWYWLDLDALDRQIDGALVEAVLFQTPEDAAAPEAPPIPQGTVVSLRNNHLEYALTWFSLAGCLIGVYIAFGLKRGRDLAGTN